MEEKIIVKNDGHFRGLFILCVVSLLIFCPLCICSGEIYACLGFLALFGSLGLISFAYALVPKLELGRENCSYRNVLGRTRYFALADIAKIGKEAGGSFGVTAFVLFDKNGKKLAEINNGMENYEKVISFFRSYHYASRIWSGREWMIPHRIYFPEYEETLEVKVDRKALMLQSLPGSLILGGLGVFFCWLGYRESVMSEGGENGMLYWGLGVACLISVTAVVQENKSLAKHERMILTCGECLYVNPNGSKKIFQFTDIKESEMQTRVAGRDTYDVLVLKDWRDREIICIKYSPYLDGVADVPAFIEYWQKINR